MLVCHLHTATLFPTPAPPAVPDTTPSTSDSTPSTSDTTPSTPDTPPADLQQMLDSLTPEQRDHMLQLISNGTAQSAPAPEEAPHHTRLYDPVGTGRLEEGNVTGVRINSIDDEMVINGTTLTAVHASAPAPAVAASDALNVTCTMLGLPANCSQEELLDAVDLKSDEEAMLMLNGTASAPWTMQSDLNDTMWNDTMWSGMRAPAPDAWAPEETDFKAPAPAPVTVGTGVLAEAAPAPPNATLVVVDSGSSNGTTIAVIVLVSVILAGIGAFVLHKHRKERRARALHQELESGGDWDWRDGEGSQVELAKARALFDNVDEEFQSLNGKPPKTAPKVMRSAKLK